jgi:SOUL heme-binding protein
MTETPKYTLLKKQNNIELRQYGSTIQAEVTVPGRDYKSAVESGFNVLAGYIFGNNIARQKIEMTTPVQVAQAQRIAMTTPVLVSGDNHYEPTRSDQYSVTNGDYYTVAFIMPAAFTLETLPVPKDSMIHFTQIPDHQVAGIRFTGYFSNKEIEQNKARLSQWLAQEGLETEGDYIIAGYNPPWIPGFLARNEVLINIKGSHPKD